MSIPDFSKTEHMRRALERMVKYAGSKSLDRVPRWSHVGSITGHGSGFSAAICIEFGQDPDELIGGPKNETDCPSCGFCLDCHAHEYEEHDDDCETSPTAKFSDDLTDTARATLLGIKGPSW